MPRKRKGEVRESHEELKRLDRAWRGKPEHVRIRFIMAIQANPHARLQDLADHVDRSLPTVKRWWKAYMTLGLSGLLELGTSTRGPRVHDKRLGESTEQIAGGQMSTVDDVAAWIARLPEVEAKRPTKRLERGSFGYPVDVSARSADAGFQSDSRVIKLISSLSQSTDFNAWSAAFRAAMLDLLPDVDHVSVSVNVHNGRPDDRNINIEEVPEAPDAFARRLVEQLHRRKFPKSEYHPPLYREYRLHGVAYLRTLVLWRRRGRVPISSATASFVDELQPVMRFVLSHYVVRHQLSTPVEHTFVHALERATDEARLTAQERRAMVLLLLGESYEEIANRLSISLNTVRHHIRSLFAKTGTHGHAELVAKYFSLRYLRLREPE